MAGTSFSLTSYVLRRKFGGNLRFLYTFADLTGRDLSPSFCLFPKLIRPDSPYEALTSWGFLSISAFWLWMLASRLGMLAVVFLVASAPWWSTFLTDDTPAFLVTAYKVTSRLFVGDLETLLVLQAALIDSLEVRCHESPAKNEALTARLCEAEQRSNQVSSSEDTLNEVMPIALLLAERTEELVMRENELAETKAELEENKLSAQNAKRVPALVETIEDLQSKLEAANELLVEKERSLQDGAMQVCEKEQELGELVDEIMALRDSECRARAGTAGTAKAMVELRADLTVAKAAVASLTAQLSEQKAVVASITAQLAEQEAETALANQEIDELRGQVDQGEQALQGIVHEANEKIHRRNAEVSRLWASVQVRLAEVDGLRWELGVCQDKMAESRKALEVFQPPRSPSAAPLDMEQAAPASDLPTIIFQSPSSEWVREKKTKVDKSLLRAPKRNNHMKSKLPREKGSKSVRAPSTSTILSSPSPSPSPSTDLPAVQPRLTTPHHSTTNIAPAPSLATSTFPAPSTSSETSTSPTTTPTSPATPSLTTSTVPADDGTVPQIHGTIPARSSTDDEADLILSPAHDENILPSCAHEQSISSPQPGRDTFLPVSLAQTENIVPTVSHEPINSHISALKADSKAFSAPARVLTVSLRLRRNPLGSILSNAPRRSRVRNQNQNKTQTQTSRKPVGITCEVDEESWTMVSFD